MRPLLSSTQMKDLDNRAIKDFGLPSRLLMETAGKACAEIIANHYPKQLAGPVCVFCGSGKDVLDFRGKLVCPRCARQLATVQATAE